LLCRLSYSGLTCSFRSAASYYATVLDLLRARPDRRRDRV